MVPVDSLSHASMKIHQNQKLISTFPSSTLIFLNFFKYMYVYVV